MKTLLTNTREKLGAAPRALAGWDHVTPPTWMKHDDPLRATYARAVALLKEGDVVWGCVVQANELLFRAGDEACPANVLFGTAAEDDLDPERLQRAARAAFELKGRTFAEGADPLTVGVARALTNELERSPVLDLPTAITRGSPMRFAAIMVHRVWLPSGYLSTMLVPLVASRARDEVAILPARFWAQDLVRGWLALGAGG